MFWRYDQLLHLLDQEKGKIDFEKAKWIMSFLSPDRTPGGALTSKTSLLLLLLQVCCSTVSPCRFLRCATSVTQCACVGDDQFILFVL